MTNGTYRDDPAWQDARARLLAEDDSLSPTDELIVRVQASIDLAQIERQYERRAA